MCEEDEAGLVRKSSSREGLCVWMNLNAFVDIGEVGFKAFGARIAVEKFVFRNITSN